MTNPELRSTITQLVNFLIHNATPDSDKPMLTEFFWPKEKKWHPQISNFDDTGDILPFITWAEIILKKPAWSKFVKTQYQWWIDHARLPSGWYLPIYNHSNPKSLNTKYLILNTSLYDHQDTLTGLYNLHLLAKDQFYSQTLDQLLEKFSTLASKTNGIIPNQLLILNRNEWPHPFSSTNPAVSGLVAEHLFLRGKQTSNQKFLKAGHTIINRWLSTKFFHTHHLLPQGLHPYLLNFPLTPQTFLYPTTKIMKENSNFLYALLQQADTYSSAINLITDQLLQFQHPSGAFFSHYQINNHQIIQDHFDKTQNFTIIDLLADIHSKKIPITCRPESNNRSHKNNWRKDPVRFTSDQLLNSATHCADFWISHTNPKTKLIPDYILPGGKTQYPIAKLDQSADLYSSFLRLYALTNNKKYLQAAQTGAQSLAQYFLASPKFHTKAGLASPKPRQRRGEGGWPHRIVNTRTEQPAIDQQVPSSDHPAGRNLTKYAGGALRFYLSLYQVQKGQNLQKHPTLWALSRDR